MRKLFTLFVAALCCASISAEIINGTSGDLTFNFNTETGVMNFDGDGAMADYKSGSDRPWHTYRDNITSVRFWGNPTAIGDNAFLSCDNLTACDFPSTLTKIGDMAFAHCALTGSVSFSYGLTTLGSEAFNNCTQITDFYLPATLTDIGTGAFAHCTGITYFAGNNDNPNYTIAGDVLFNKDKTVLMYYPAAHSRTSYTVPQSVTEIGDFAFADCKGLTSVTIPNSVKSIGDFAFGNCIGLTSVTIPNSVTNIGNYAFERCTGLTSVTIPNSVQSIGEWAFADCSNLTALTIGNSVQSIGTNAFYNCSGLTTITCKAVNPPTLGYAAFYRVDKTIPLYVPAQSVEAYKAADGWKDFKDNTYPIPDEAIDQTTNNKSQTTNHKLIKNGQLLIQRGNQLFNVQGAEVK